MYLKLKDIPLWPPRDVVQANMPKCFRDLYPTTRVIIDATEVYIENPSLPDLQQMTFSNYKTNNMFKGVIGISPSGAITFVSIIACFQVPFQIRSSKTECNTDITRKR